MLKDGRRVPAHLSCLPMLRAADAEPEAPEEEEEEEEEVLDGDGNAAIGMASTMTRGWLCSYRRNQPELRLFSSWRKRWQKARLRWESTDKVLLAPSIRQEPAPRKALQAKWRARRKARARRGAA